MRGWWACSSGCADPQPDGGVGRQEVPVEGIAGDEDGLVLGQCDGGVAEVDDARDGVAPAEREDLVRRAQPGHGAVAKAGLGPANGEGGTVEREYRARVGLLCLDGELGPRHGLREPGLDVVPGGAEAVRL